MSKEEALRQLKNRLKVSSRELEKFEKEKDIGFAELKGRVEGIRLGKLNSVQEGFLALFELVLETLASHYDQTVKYYRREIGTTQMLIDFEKRIGELETNIQQIREALDEEFHLFQGR